MDSYSTCFCGSGDKYKFCCQKAESQIIRVERLIESEDFDAALAAATDAAKKLPEAAMLAMHKAMLESRSGDFDSARRTLESFLARRPRHAGALAQHLMVILQTDGPISAVMEFQRLAGSLTDTQRPLFSAALSEIASELNENDYPVPALAHQQLATLFSGGQNTQVRAMSEMLADRSVSLLLRQLPNVEPAPESIPAEQKAAFDQILNGSVRGAYYDSAIAFEQFTDRDLLPLATYNRGIMLAYLGQNAAAVACIRAYIGTLGQSDNAVDLEAFCQELLSEENTAQVDMIQLSWPIRSRPMLEQTLSESRRFQLIKQADLSPENTDPDARRSIYVMLDRPQIAEGVTPTIENLPIVAGTVTVEDKNMSLAAQDDGRLDSLSEELREIAGAAVVPAHPRTKHVGKNPKPKITNIPAWVLPEKTSTEARSAVMVEFVTDLIEKRLEKEPLIELGGLTIPQYLATDKSRVPLRAFLRRVEASTEFSADDKPIAAFRAKVGLPVETADPSIKINELNGSRLMYVDINKLSIADLATFCSLSSSFGLVHQSEAGLRKLMSLSSDNPEELRYILMAYMDMANILFAREGLDVALKTLQEGQARDPEAGKPLGALGWEIIALRLKAVSTQPEEWVPLLAVMLSQYGKNGDAMRVILPVLVNLGIVRPTRDPSRPDKIMLDTALLDALIDKFGPKITTPSGGLGIAAGKPSIWTPGSETAKADGGKLWTPGQNKPGGGESGSKLIIPGGK